MEEVQQSAPQIEETLEVVEENNTQQIENNYEPAPQQTVEQSAEQNDLKQGDDNVVDLAMKEIQESLNEVSNQVEVTSNNPKAKIIEEKIVAVSNKISKLDMENKKLEEKFQNVLRENRELAKQLHDIDQQLTQSN
jgi:predicted RNase H-like nuclease (RuvC/YqgF family)